MNLITRILTSLILLLIVTGVSLYLDPLWAFDQFIRFSLWRGGARSKYIDVNGYHAHYFEASASDASAGTPLLLIHGLGSRSEDWAPLVSSLCEAGFRVYVLDMLGYGRSPRPDVDYSIDLEARFVAEFIQAAGIAKADVGGWSMGGWVAAKLALDHPELVNRLVLYDSAGIYFSPTFDNSIFTPSDSAGLARLADMLEPNPPKIPEFIARAAVRRLQVNAWVIRRSVSAMTNGRDLLDFRLPQMKPPTLIVWGSKDVLIPLHVGLSMHRLIPGSSMTIIDGCGHVAAEQCSRSTTVATIDFLKAEPAPKGLERTLPGN